MLRCEEAKPGDMLEIVEMLLEMHSEVSFTLGPPDRRKIVDALAPCERWVIKDFDDSIGGIIAFREATVWYSTAPFIADLVFYVRPAYRASRAASLLLRKAKERAKIKGLPLVLAANSGDDIPRKVKLYERMGFRQVGASFTLKDS